MRKLTFQLVWLALVILAPFSTTKAAIETIGPFNGQLSEGFETQEGPYLTELSVFCELGTVRNLDDSPNLHITGYWAAIGVVSSRSGICFMGSTGDGVEWIFDIPAGRFGGYFTTLSITSNSEGAVANFYDVADNLLVQKEVNAPYSEWTWNGWVSDVPIKRVEVIGLGLPDWLGAGGFVMHDDMEYTPFGEPRLIHYVDADATGANDGSSWADAYNYLQDALFNALPGTEIQVAEGIYKPHLNSYSLAPVSRADTFWLRNCITIKGGYAGFGEPDPDARDVEVYKTILSGDINGNDAAVGSPEELLTEPTRAENSYHVVTAIGVDGKAVLDGFSVTGGTADGETNENKYGGGMYNYDASPTVKDCKFGTNSADGGGAIYIRGDFSGTLTDCLFENNTAALGGGAIYCTGTGELSIIRCEFRDGTANRGGVIYNGYASLILSECILESNQAEYAGAISTGGDITLINCLLANNQALVWGGALSNMENTSRSINCTFVGNSANYGGAIFSNIECDTIAINSIFWNNSAQIGSQIATSGSHGGSTLTVNYCDIENLLDGLYVPNGCTLNWGEDNINAEPLFADSGNGNYRLSAGSLCVDSGDNGSVPPDVCDLDGNDRIDDGDGDGSLVVDMGAYELGLPPIEVEVKFVPQSLNPGSKGKWVKTHFVLPEGLAVEDVDTDKPVEFEQFQLTSESMEVFVNKEDLVEVIAAFDRSAFFDIGPFEGDVTVVGYLTSGRRFSGTDTIKIANNKLK